MNIPLFRKNEWWHSKMPFLLGIVYLVALSTNMLFSEIWINIFVFLFLIITIAAFGYFLNDSFDIEEDALVGKVNFAARFSTRNRFKILIVLFVFGYLPWYFFSEDPFLLALLAAHLLLLLLYSIPPIRLKNRGMIALIIDAGYSFILPVLVSFYFINDSTIDRYSIPLLIVWSTTIGIRNIIEHHRDDARFDNVSYTFNISNHKGENRMKLFMYYLLLPLELIFFVFLLVSFKVSYGYFLLLFGIFLLAEIIINLSYDGFKIYKLFGSKFSSINSCYEYILPSYLLVLLSINIDINYLVLLLFHNTIFFNSLLYSYVVFSFNIFKTSKWLLLFDKIKSVIRQE
jgi:4-hydroxybenzoate polyprenyltransferase